jgi:hypothetical protein
MVTFITGIQVNNYVQPLEWVFPPSATENGVENYRLTARVHEVEISTTEPFALG